jgi:AraC-like DNA-binding protein
MLTGTNSRNSPKRDASNSLSLGSSIRLGFFVQTNQLEVNEIAYSVEFSSHAYFSKCFREAFGCAAKEFVKARRGRDENRW